MKRIILLIVTGCVLANAASMAADSTDAVKQFIQKAQQAYRSAAYLSFHITYRYANKNQPDNYIDTLSGEVAMDKSRMRFLVGDVETVTNDQYTIRLVKDEKLIYLSAPQPAQMTDPVAMLDTMLAHFEGIQTRVTREKGMVTLQLGFPPGQTYKNITMAINETTGYFQKVVYELYTAGLVEEDQLAGPDKNGPYQSEGRIEILFSQYRQGQFTDALFKEDRYFTRLGKGKYEPSETYKDYRIFLASSSL